MLLNTPLYTCLDDHGWTKLYAHASTQVLDPTPGGPTAGFCSGWLCARRPGDIVRMNVIRMPSFKLPLDMCAPTVLIGAGAGIAPLRGMWQVSSQCRDHYTQSVNSQSVNGQLAVCEQSVNSQ